MSLRPLPQMVPAYLRNHPLQMVATRMGIQYFCACLLVLVIVLLCPHFLEAKQKKAFQESQVKAVFLYNLTKFVTWPPPSTSTENLFFTIGILGKHPLAEHLEKVVENELTKGKKIKVVQYNSTAAVKDKDIELLFITSEFADRYRHIKSQLVTSAMLTVGDSKGFCNSGGMINMLTKKKRIKLEVNLGEVKNSKLKISAQVLKLAKLITSSNEADQ